MSINIKYIAIEKTINIILRGAHKSPERSARNLIDLGMTIHRGNTEYTAENLYQSFLELCKNNDKAAIKDLFFQSFFN